MKNHTLKGTWSLWHERAIDRFYESGNSVHVFGA
jgi:hypothetical protein